MKTFAERLIFMRKLYGLSQSKLAKALRSFDFKRLTITRNAITMWESGKVKDISANNLLKLSSIFNVSPYWLLHGDDGILMEPQSRRLPPCRRLSTNSKRS